MINKNRHLFGWESSMVLTHTAANDVAISRVQMPGHSQSLSLTVLGDPSKLEAREKLSPRLPAPHLQHIWMP
jgi:hypothetical protein